MNEESDVAALDPRLRWLIDEARQPVAVAPEAKARLLAALAAEPAPVRELHPAPAWRWALERRTLRLSPLLGGALAAGLVGIGVLAGLLGRGGDRTATREAAFPPAGVVPIANRNTPNDVVVEPGVVKFVFVAPAAAKVALVGDFNGWDPTRTPMQRTGGTWTVTLPLEAGRHLYNFVVDETQWLPDPSAPLAPDDGFGHTNSVVLVGGTST